MERRSLADVGKEVETDIEEELRAGGVVPSLVDVSDDQRIFAK